MRRGWEGGKMGDFQTSVDSNNNISRRLEIEEK